MKVIVKVHEQARADYEAWMARHSRPPTGSAELAKLLRDELLAELERTEGRPTGALWVEMGSQSHYQWRFSADTWVRFVLSDQPPKWLRPAVRKVVITAIADSATG